MPNDHAFISPSNLAALEKCPGKAWAEKDYPRQSSEAAIDGTHSHTLREACLNLEGFDMTTIAEYHIGKTLGDHEGEFTVDAERAKRVQQSIDNITRLIPEGGYHLLIEQTVHPGAWFGRKEEFWGTADTILDTAEFILVDDFKDGGQPVYAEDNLQLAAYALGYLHGKNVADDFPVKLSINQPKHTSELKVWETTAGELVNVWLPRIQGIVERVLDSNSPRIPGEHCVTGYCLHRQNCKERLTKVQEIMNMLLQTVPTPQNLVASEFSKLPKVEEMTPAQFAAALDYKPIIDGWFADVEEESLKQGKQGVRIPGHKMVRAETRRKYIDDEEQIKKVLKGMGLKKGDYLEEKLVSFTKVLNHDNLSDRQKARIEKELIVKPQGGFVLVPESDKRLEVCFDAQEQLKEIPAAGETAAPNNTLSFL